MADIISTLPFNLTNGSTADASQVMANLNQIVDDVNENAAAAATFTGPQPSIGGDVSGSILFYMNTGDNFIIPLSIGCADTATELIFKAIGYLPAGFTASILSPVAGTINEIRLASSFFWRGVNISFAINGTQILGDNDAPPVSGTNAIQYDGVTEQPSASVDLRMTTTGQNVVAVSDVLTITASIL